MGCHTLLQGIFPTQGSNPGLQHCRQILYHLSYQRSPLLRKQLKHKSRDFPGGLVAGSPTCQGRGHRFDPFSRKIPHAEEQLSLCAKTTEPEARVPRACALQPETPPQEEAHAPQPERSPCSLQPERARRQRRRPNATIN